MIGFIFYLSKFNLTEIKYFPPFIPEMLKSIKKKRPRFTTKPPQNKNILSKVKLITHHNYPDQSTCMYLSLDHR